MLRSELPKLRVFYDYRGMMRLLDESTEREKFVAKERDHSTGFRLHPALRFGVPDTGRLLVREAYVLSYDGRTRTPRWVAERRDRESLESKVERFDSFRPDFLIPPEFKADLPDYMGSGWTGAISPRAETTRNRRRSTTTAFFCRTLLRNSGRSIAGPGSISNRRCANMRETREQTNSTWYPAP